MCRFIHAADIHLDSPLRGLERYEGAPVEAIRGASRRAFENLVELAIDKQVAFVLLCGDLYDGDWKDYNTGLFFISQMARLKTAEIRVFIISGNHDAASQITKHLTLPDNVTLMSNKAAQTVVLDDVGIAVHGQGYATRAVLDDLSIGYPPARPGLFNIGMLHTSLTGRKGHHPYAPCTEQGLRAKGYDYWALGHVHKREEVSHEPWIVFPGNIQGRHARELGPKGCTLVTVSDGAVESVEHVDLDVLRWEQCDVDVSQATSGSEVVEAVKDALSQQLAKLQQQTLAARVCLVGATEAHGELNANPMHWRQEIRATALDLGADRVWIEKVKFQTQNAVDLADLLAGDDALASLLTLMDDVKADDERLDELAGHFDDLRSKLPKELTEGEDGIALDNRETLREAIDGAREVLLAGLMGHGGAQ
jgi:DNA repair exonuclease SbcCD nuclease subunit